MERDVEITAACARALCAFFIKHSRVFEDEALDPVRESYLDERDLEVRLTAPYEAFPQFDISSGPEPRPRAARWGGAPVAQGRVQPPPQS